MSDIVYDVVDIRNNAKSNFLNYATYVIVDRALPDIRDGMKPVHRRILHAMNQLNLDHNKAYKKSARIVGDVIGKYHPHGDNAVYDTMVRMAQEFSMRLPLVDGQGNFGSIDGDNAAAMRYTESRMTIFSEQVFNDINLNTVNFIDNYDGSLQEPAVLPIAFPNLLINGVQGIAVGMASNIPPHNPLEVMKTVIRLSQSRINKEHVSTEELVSLIPSPDFPTGGQVYELNEMSNAIENGRGRVRLRSVWHPEVINGNNSIVITEIPYQVDKTVLIENIVEVCKTKRDNKTKLTIPPKVDGVIEVRDESDKEGVRLVIECRDDVEPEIIFVQLCKMTRLETSINYNCTVIKDARPQLVGLRTIFNAFIDHRLEVITRRTETLDKKAAERQHILYGLIKAIESIDYVIDIIKKSSTPAHAQVGLIDYLLIDEIQAQAILEMKLQRLTGMQISNLRDEHTELTKKREGYAKILGSENVRLEIIQTESEDIIHLLNRQKDSMGDSLGVRRTEVAHHLSQFNKASLTPEENCVMHLSNRGYVRRLPVDQLNTQRRNTQGKSSMDLRKEDYLMQTLPVHSHDIIIAVTDKGRAYGFYAYDIPVSDSGRHLSNLIDTKEDKIIRILSVKTLEDDQKKLVMMTRNGLVKSTNLTEYVGIMRKSGLAAIMINEDDSLIQACVANKDDVVISLRNDGRLVRFHLDTINTTSRKTRGVRAQKIDEGMWVQHADVMENKTEGYLVVLTENGLVKVSSLEHYPPVRKRGGVGVKSFKMTEKTGMALKVLFTETIDEMDMCVITEKGMTNRIPMSNIRSTARHTQGVMLSKTKKGDSIVDGFIADSDPESEDVINEENLEVYSEEE